MMTIRSLGLIGRFLKRLPVALAVVTLLPGRAALLVSTLIHEPLELLAIPGVAEIFHEFREFALGGDELLAFFFQPREFSGAPLIEGAISGRAHAKNGGGPIIYRKAPAAGTVRPVSPFFSPERNNVARVTGFLLPEFPAQDGETDRPEHHEAQNHRQDFYWLP